MLKRLQRSFGWRLEDFQWGVRKIFAKPGTQWARIVMDREMEAFLHSLGPERLDAVEISGDKWGNFGFKTYRCLQFPEYDLCKEPAGIAAYDLVIAEQVLEHVRRPYRAVCHAWEMLRPGGIFAVNTPFLIRVHEDPEDFSRWTEKGLRQLLVEGGFEESAVQTGSWGNRACVRATLGHWAGWVPWKDSLENEPQFPVVVWAFAKK